MVKKWITLFTENLKLLLEGDSLYHNPKDHQLFSKSNRQLHDIEEAIVILSAEIIRQKSSGQDESKQLLQQYLYEHFKMSNPKADLLMELYYTQYTKPYIRISCERLKQTLAADSILQLMKFFFEIAAINNMATHSLIKSLKKIAHYLSVSQHDFTKFQQEAFAEYSAFLILNVDENADWETIKRAYKKAILQFHPDKQTGKISPEEANEKFINLKRAFEQLAMQYEHN